MTALTTHLLQLLWLNVEFVVAIEQLENGVRRDGFGVSCQQAAKLSLQRVLASLVQRRLHHSVYIDRQIALEIS